MPDDRKPWAVTRATLIISTFNAIGCAALNVGDRDLAAGLDTLKSLAKKAKFPFVSANLLDAATKKPIFPAFQIAEVAGTKIGFVGLLSPKSLPAPAVAVDRSYEVADPAVAVKDAVAAAKKAGARYVVLLSQLRPDELEPVIAAAPDIALVLGSQLPQRQEFLGITAERPHAESYTKGKYLGVVVLHVQPSGDALVQRDRGDAIVREIQAVDGRIRRQERQRELMAARADAQQDRIDYYQRSLDQMLGERQALVKKLETVGKVDPVASFLSFQLAPLGRGQAEDTAIKGMVEAFKAENPEPAGTKAGLHPSIRARGKAEAAALPAGKAVDARRLAPLRMRPPSGLQPPSRASRVPVTEKPDDGAPAKPTESK